ncbi:MAG: DUF1206 domain-containing protein [Proteobacteria bacterium]|nr:MAG: DUF1206 domain-containing protein [Pseudomonadota bacterium]
MNAAPQVKKHLRKYTSEKGTHVFARAGFAARAVLYGAMGIFALLFSYGRTGGLTDVRGVLRKLIEQPFGGGILCLIALGLFSYALFRIAQAFRDYDGHGTSAKGILLRTGHFLGGIFHLGLGYYAINLVLHLTAEEKKGPAEQHLAQQVLDQPLGRWLLALLGLAVIGFGVFQVVVALREKFLRDLELPARNKTWICGVCKFGLIARAAVFGVIGWLFIKAALEASSREAGGVAGAWKFLSSQEFGSILVPLLAMGLIAFAAYGLAQAVYRKV